MLEGIIILILVSFGFYVLGIIVDGIDDWTGDLRQKRALDKLHRTPEYKEMEVEIAKRQAEKEADPDYEAKEAKLQAEIAANAAWRARH